MGVSTFSGSVSAVPYGEFVVGDKISLLVSGKVHRSIQKVAPTHTDWWWYVQFEVWDATKNVWKSSEYKTYTQPYDFEDDGEWRNIVAGTTATMQPKETTLTVVMKAKS